MIGPRALLRGNALAPARARGRHRPARRQAWHALPPAHRAWLVAWAPWWVGNELPPPAAPLSREPDMIDPPEGTPGAWILDTLDDLRFRFGLSWALALLLRGAALGGLVGIAWLALALPGWLPAPAIRTLLILAGVGMALGLVLRGFHRPRYLAVALLMERAFDLRSRLSTAVLGLRYGQPDRGDLHAVQLADAAYGLERARGQLQPVHWVPIRELFITVIVAMTLLLLLVAQRPEGDIPPPSRTGVPAFVPVSERLAAAERAAPPENLPDPATLQEVEDLSRASNQAREDLSTIGAALDTSPVTSPAGAAIADEDYPEANRSLSDSSGDVMALPQEERDALADELDDAADDVSEENPELAQAARDAADDVRSGEDSGALDDLGDEIEQTGESVISQEATGPGLGDPQASEQGGSQESGSSGGASQPAAQQPPGDQSAGETQPGTSGDPGAGVEASGGTGSEGEGSEAGQPSDATGGGDQGESGGNAGQAGESDDPTSQGESGQAQEGASGSDTSGDGRSTSGAPNEEGDTAQGAGAGGGQTDANDPTDETAEGGGSGAERDESAPESGDGEAGEPPEGGSDEEDPAGQDAAAGGASVQLPGTSGERVRSGSDVGASSVGTGGGVGAAAGDSSGSARGSTGPDPNTVPEQWRSIVERYFREGGAP